MFPYPIATPQGCNIQTFYGPAFDTTATLGQTWNKPVGVSHVYMMLIGGGGNGNGTVGGGGSGAVTVWYGAAQHVPDNLIVNASAPDEDTTVQYRGTSTVTLLTARGGSGINGGNSTSSGPFGASGFYASKTGSQGGLGIINASADTFLSGGGLTRVDGNYGYSTATNAFFQMQPIIVGVGAVGNRNGAIGCGNGGAGLGTYGGPGMVLIASW
jgi:hypothetical protein